MTEWRGGWRARWRREWRGREPRPDFGGWGPPGAATLSLVALNKGYTVRYSYATDVIKSRGGSETRASIIDAPKQSYTGEAVLLGDQRAEAQTLLAQYAALGSTFLLGLQHESLSIQDVDGTVVTVDGATGDTDWAAQVGQRVVCVSGDRSVSVTAVIQSATSTQITLDVAPGSADSEILPLMPVLLEPEQEFQRYRTEAETWKISARGALVDFAPTLAALEFSEFTADADFADVRVVARRFGLIGNDTSFEMSTGGPATGALVEADGIVSVTFQDGTTTLADLATLLASSSYVKLAGAYSASTKLVATGSLLSLSGAEDGGPIGAGASVTEYNSRPVWDREIEGVVSDSVHSMTRIIDHGGVPYAVATADQPDWGRAISISSLDRGKWQWLKKFLDTVKGMQKAFWLPTWRPDLEAVSIAGASLTVEGSVAAWYPKLRDRVQIKQVDGVVTYAKITAATKSGANTVLTLSASLPSAADVEMVSWLEFCRFESDDFDVAFGKRGWFALDTNARVVPVKIDATGELDYDEAEESWERSMPREFADITYEGVTHRIAFGVRDMRVNSVLYTAVAAGRGTIVPAGVGKDSALELTLPADHPLAVRYTQLGVPPQKITVTLWELQKDVGTVERLWDGEVSSASVDDDWTEMTFRVPNRAGRAALQIIPSITVSRTCPVVHYGTACGVLRSGSGPTGIPHEQVTTVSFVNGREVRVDLPDVTVSDSLRPQWAKGGELYFVSKDTWETIEAQADVSPGVSTVAKLTLSRPIFGLKVGDTVKVYAGCQRRIVEDCDAKFDNRQNFRGAPDLPTANPFVPGSSGVDGMK